MIYTMHVNCRLEVKLYMDIKKLFTIINIMRDGKISCNKSRIINNETSIHGNLNKSRPINIIAAVDKFK